MSPSWKPLHLIPTIDSEVKKACNEEDEFVITSPTVSKGVLAMAGVPVQDSYCLKCHSVCVKKPNTVCKCNSTITTIIGKVAGEQVQIVECGKCRSAYLVRTKEGEKGEPQISAQIWDVSRNLKNFAEVFPLAPDRSSLVVRFNKK